jgi:hypothetical protein
MKKDIEELLARWGVDDFEIEQKNIFGCCLYYQINLYGDKTLIKNLFTAGLGKRLTKLSYIKKFEYNCSIEGKRGFKYTLLKLIKGFKIIKKEHVKLIKYGFWFGFGLGLGLGFFYLNTPSG